MNIGCSSDSQCRPLPPSRRSSAITSATPNAPSVADARLSIVSGQSGERYGRNIGGEGSGRETSSNVTIERRFICVSQVLHPFVHLVNHWPQMEEMDVKLRPLAPPLTIWSIRLPSHSVHNHSTQLPVTVDNSDRLGCEISSNCLYTLDADIEWPR